MTMADIILIAIVAISQWIEALQARRDCNRKGRHHV